MQNKFDKTTQEWDLTILPSSEKKKTFNFSELKNYKDLLFLFVKRDFISLYKQTILGPLWVIIQPILTTATFYIVFTKIATIGTGGIPPILFYLIGVTSWTYFADCVSKTAETFIANQNIFGKVYFPRLIVPLSLVITNLIKFGVQIVLFIAVYFSFLIFTEFEVGISWQISLIPLLIVIMAMLGLGVGLIISALTTKYRDLRFLISFGIQLVMYGTPVVWPLSNIPEEHQWKLMLNPMTSIIESFKVGIFGEDFGTFNVIGLLYSLTFGVIVLIVGFKMFTRIEKSFMDTI
jgi:lipopolysaccharide transport system permease protein